MARKKRLTLVAASKPQLRTAAARDWSKEKARDFLGVLAETCNVSEACRRSGVPMTVACRRRKLDAAFRAEWAEMIAIGYHRLEGVLLERAFNGTEKVITKRDGSEERMHEYGHALIVDKIVSVNQLEFDPEPTETQIEIEMRRAHAQQ